MQHPLSRPSQFILLNGTDFAYLPDAESSFYLSLSLTTYLPILLIVYVAMKEGAGVVLYSSTSVTCYRVTTPQTFEFSLPTLVSFCIALKIAVNENVMRPYSPSLPRTMPHEAVAHNRQVHNLG